MNWDSKTAQKATGFYPYKDGQERPKGDFYATPRQAVDGLLSKETFGEVVLEPCCGNGAISRVLEETGHRVISRDLYDWGYGETGKDFLTEPISVDAVVTNSPFNLSFEFAVHSLECTKERKGKVALLNRLVWLESVKRKKLFTETPLARVWVFSKRIPRMHRFDYDGKSGTSLICFAWFIWDWKYSGQPILGWI